MASDLLNGNRTRTFWALSILIMFVIIVMDVMNYCDPCLMVYGSIATLALSCAVFFAIWWHVKGSATSIFKWVTILLLSLAYNDSVNFVARYLYKFRPELLNDFMASAWWSYRSVPKLIAMVYLLTFAIWQRFGSHSTYHDSIRQDMAEGFEALDAKIIAGELKFEGHSHDGLILGAKIILKTRTEEIIE